MSPAVVDLIVPMLTRRTLIAVVADSVIQTSSEKLAGAAAVVLIRTYCLLAVVVAVSTDRKDHRSVPLAALIDRTDHRSAAVAAVVAC